MIMYSDLTKYGQGRGSDLFTRRTETTKQHKSAQNFLVRPFWHNQKNGSYWGTMVMCSLLQIFST